MYQLYGSFASRTQRILWALMELDVEFAWEASPPHSDIINKINPTGRIPVLEVDGEILTDSHAILNFLVDRHHQLGFEAGTADRAKQDALIGVAIDFFDGPLWMAVRAGRLGFEADQAFNAALGQILAKGFGEVEAELEDKRYLFGDMFSVADIYTAHCLAWARSMKFDLPKSLLDYYRRAYAREAPKKMRELYT